MCLSEKPPNTACTPPPIMPKLSVTADHRQLGGWRRVKPRPSGVMYALDSYGDERALAFCAMCGGDTPTRDHLPAKILLDLPLPEPSHIVRKCFSCNNGLGAHEDYLACCVEIARLGTVDPDQLERERVRKILKRSPALTQHFRGALNARPGEVSLNINRERVAAVLTKQAKGHALYELHQPQYSEPSAVWFRSLHLMSEEQLRMFEEPPSPRVWPEVGSRAMQRMVLGNVGWVVRQPGRYRYLAIGGAPVLVRAVLSEYLVAEVVRDASLFLTTD